MFPNPKNGRAPCAQTVPVLAPGKRVRAPELYKAQWLVAMRWRRLVNGACRTEGLTFSQWLVLDALRELVDEVGQAVNQNEIAARVELDSATVSQVMRTLDRKHLVDRGGGWGRSWLVIPTKKAKELLLRLYPLLDAASSSVQTAPPNHRLRLDSY